MTVFPKNLLVYKAKDGFLITEEDLKRSLNDFAFVDCGPSDKAKTGWLSPFSTEQMYHCHGTQDFLLKYCKQERKINASAFNQMLTRTVSAMEEEDGRPLNKRQKDQIRDELLSDILPNALPVNDYINLFIIESGKYIAIDSANHNKAETVLALLRKSLGSLPVIPLLGDTPAETVITEWVRSGETPAGIVLGNSAKLKSILDDGPIIGVKSADLSSEEIQAHIAHNAMVREVGIDFQDRVAFSLTDGMQIKGLKFSDEIKDQNEDIPKEDVLARLDADLALVFGEIKTLIFTVFSSFSKAK